ncbi:MAG TPA: hypothetical protein VFG89_08970 [Coriobacteriia bacterium]|nr:hypothetical protein [Coriobacteriia bacterium]
MDATTIATQPTGLLAWISQYGNVVYFFAQIAFWLGMLVLVAYAVVQYKRWVNYQLGTGRSGALRMEQQAGSAPVVAEDKNVSVDEFVD